MPALLKPELSRSDPRQEGVAATSIPRRSSREPHRHPGLEGSGIAERIEAQAQRVAVVIADRTFGLGPSRSSQLPNACSDAAACEQGEAVRRFEQLARVCVGQIMVHLRRSEPAKRSAYLFCQGEESDMGRSRIPIAHVSSTHVLCFSLRSRWEPLAAVAARRRMQAPAQRLRLPLLQLRRRQLGGRIRWGTQMRLTGELACDLMFLLFARLLAASNGGDCWSSSILARCCSRAGSSQAHEMPSRRVGTVRSSIGVTTDET